MLVFLFFVCTTTLSYAQHMVSGVVKDVTGEPIIGANVVEKGTTNGSITDIDGKFSFSISTDCCRIKRIEPFGYRIGRGLERCFRNGHLRFAWSQWRDPGDN